MISSRLLSYLCCLYALMKICEPLFYRPDFQDSKFCPNDFGNYTTNSTYHTNLNTLLSTLTSNTQIDYGFYNFSYGHNPDKVYAIGLCRGDIKADECRNCLNNCRLNLTQNCPNQKEAIAYEEKCMLRYSNNSIFGIMNTDPLYYWSNPEDAKKADEFNEELAQLLRKLKGKAASGDSRLKYATDTAIVAKFEPIYALVQCTPDLSSQDCDACVDWSISYILNSSLEDKSGGMMLRPSCFVRYEIYRFYQLNHAPPPSSLPISLPPSPQHKGKGNSLKTTIALIVLSVFIVVAVLLIFIGIYFIWRVKSRKSLLADEEDEDEIKMVESLQFNLDTILVATSNFTDSSKLGEGGFGAVYQGKLSNGQMIAVKRMSRNSGQGDLEFKNEVLLLAKLQHRNLVRLLGFCLEGSEKLLIYEFVPNKSLDHFIFDPTKKAQLDWERRYRIIGGIARGLLYLHEDSRLRIIHRDLKPSNILLNEEMIPKIADFGMARLIAEDQTQKSTSRIVGTYGYMAPEYIMHGHFSVKSDVFSFGVLVLEIVSGKKNHGICHEETEESLLNFAWRNWREGTVTNIIDPLLKNNSQDEMIRCIHIGLLCVQENLVNRPPMANVALMLNSCSITLPVPSKPAFFMDSATTSIPSTSWEGNSGTTRSTQSTNKSVLESGTEDSITELYPS